MTKSKISAAVVGAHLDLSRQRIGQLVDDGVLHRLPDGSFDLNACRRAYIRWLRRDDGRAATAEVDRRMRDLKGDELQLRIEERSKALITEARAAAVEVSETYGGQLRADLGALPARLTNDLALRRKFQDGIDDAFRAASRRIGSKARSGRPAGVGVATNG